VHGTLVERSDGSLWRDPAGVVLKGDGAPLIVVSSARGMDFSCGVEKDGKVSCWNDAGSVNQDGELGTGTAAGSTIPTEVVIGASGPALTGIKKVFSGSNSRVSCAIDGDGALWCWGGGLVGALGNGQLANSNFAVPVLTEEGGAQLDGVLEVSTSNEHACALTTSGKLFCWGQNGDGQVGVEGALLHPYPVEVVAPEGTWTHVSVIDLSVVTCATTTNGSVWCWGGDGYGQLGDGKQTGHKSVPSQVLVDENTPFTGASAVEVVGSNVIAMKGADNSLWWWGSHNAHSNYAIPYAPSATQVKGVLLLADHQGTYVATYVDAAGVLHREDQVVSVPCP